MKLTAADVYERFGERLDLTWAAGRKAAAGRSITSDDVKARPSLVGYLSLIHPNQIQVLGAEEFQWLDTLEAKQRWATVARMIDGQPVALIIANGLDVPSDLLEAAEESRTPLLSTRRPSFEVVNFLEYQVTRLFARSTILHGVFMEVFTIGLLVTGDPGSGKSELALELLTRGHRLVADDAPEFTQITPDIIDGTCPPAIQDNLEVRGLGVLNVREMFGDSAVKLNKFLRFIVHLHLPESGDREQPDRLSGDTSTVRVLDLDVPRITLPVLPGRNLAVMVEAAVRDFMLKMKGFDAGAEFVRRHGEMMKN